MILAIRERRAFDRLSREGTRINRPALWCTCCPDPETGSTSVAFAFGRALGSAVVRNRLRRRVRAILRDLDRRDRLPAMSILIGARPRATELTFEQLRQELTELIDQARRSCSAAC